MNAQSAEKLANARITGCGEIARTASLRARIWYFPPNWRTKSWWLVLVGGTSFVTWYNSKFPKHAPMIVNALITAACISILMFTATGHLWLSVPVTEDNVEHRIRDWTNNRGVSITT